MPCALAAAVADFSPCTIATDTCMGLGACCVKTRATLSTSAATTAAAGTTTASTTTTSSTTSTTAASTDSTSTANTATSVAVSETIGLCVPAGTKVDAEVTVAATLAPYTAAAKSYALTLCADLAPIVLPVATVTTPRPDPSKPMD